MDHRLFAVCLALLAWLAWASEPPSKTPVKAEAPGIVNFSRLDGNTGQAGASVGFGGATAVEAMPWLRAQGFATVINLRLPEEKGAELDASRAAAEAAGLKFVSLPVDHKPLQQAAVDQFLAALAAPGNQPVYVHCGSATRVAALWMVGRVLKDGWKPEAAAKEAELIAAKPAEALKLAKGYLATLGTKATPAGR